MEVTLDHVARAAKLSRTTVGRALRNDARYSVETREKVRKIADRLGYRPNPLLTTLMTSRRKKSQPDAVSIACVSDLDAGRVKNLWLDQFYAAIRERASLLGFGSEKFYLQEYGWNEQALLKVLHARGMSGLVWEFSRNSPVPTSPLLKNFAVVTIGTETRDYSSVNSDAFDVIQLAVEKTLELGYRRPTLLLLYEGTKFGMTRYRAGWSDAVKNVPVVCDWPIHYKPDRTDFLAWVDRHQPDVIISNSSHPPYDGVPFIPLDWISPLHTMSHLNCPGIDTCRRIIGTIATDIVATHLYHNERGAGPFARHVHVPGEWMPRNQT